MRDLEGWCETPDKKRRRRGTRIVITAFVLLLVAVPSIAQGSKKPVVAVLYFDNNSGDPELDAISKGFADMVITDMSDSEQVIVVEREKLQSLLDESKLQRSRFFDKKTAVKIGKGLGASHVVSGSFTVVKDRMRIDVRFIEIKTSKVVLSTQVTGMSTEIFALEQKLVSDFLRKLNLKFSPMDLPPTKVPNLKALLAYSKGLALMDEGEDQKAALMLKSAVQLAPAFALARVRHSTILTRLAASKSQRSTVIADSSTALFARARSYVDSHKLAELDETKGQAYLAYRGLLGGEIAVALHAASAGRSSASRMIPRKRGKLTIGLMRAYYENLRLLIAEQQAFQARFPHASARLDASEEAVARELDFDYRDGSPAETLLQFVLDGRVKDVTPIESYRIAPALADVDPKIKKAAIKLAEQLAHAKPGSSVAYEQHMMVRAHEILAEYFIEHQLVEEGIAEYQKILDRFPTLSRWDYYETQIKKQLGLSHDHQVSNLQRYAKGLKQCDAWDMHVGKGVVLSQRLATMGFAAFPAMLKEVEQSCKKSPDLPKMKKSLYQSFFLSAASYEDCELFERYMKAWLDHGGSTSDAVGYRKNYSDCPIQAP